MTSFGCDIKRATLDRPQAKPEWLSSACNLGLP